MWHYRAVLLAAATCIVTLVPVPVPVATAEELVRRDARHDVWWDDELVGRRGADPDIARLRVAHREQALVVRVAFAVLKPRRQQGIQVRVWTPDPGDGRRLYDLSVYRARANGSTLLSIAGPFVPGSEHLEFTCDGMEARIALGRDFIHVRVPRACLGTPEWVRAAVWAARTPRGWRGTLDAVADDGFTKWSTLFSQARSRRLLNGEPEAARPAYARPIR